ncbi:MAG: ATP-binding protein, partial [Phycisphaeraceae bacterium]
SESVNPEPGTRNPQQRIVLLRPMLNTSRAQVLAYLADLNQPWREDHTNRDTSRWRARLRKDVLPHLHELRPEAGLRATGLADHVRQVSRVLDDAVEAMRDRVVVEGEERIVDRTDARSQRGVVLSGLLRTLLIEKGVGADRLTWRTLRPVVRAIRDTTGGKRTFEFAGGVVVKVTRAAVMIR